MTASSVVEERTIELATGPVRLFSGGNGPPLVMLHHDFEATGWGEFHDELSASFSVFAPEMPGYGSSARLEWARHPRDVAAVLLALVRRLDLRDYTLVGLGFGGWVAAEMSSFAPERIARLVLVGAAGIKPDTSDILDQIMMDHRDYVKAGFANPEKAVELFGEKTDPERKARWDTARETVARISWRPYMYSYELQETLREMPVPTTVIWGTEDAVVPPRCASLYASIIPNASVRLIDGGGHWLDLERPQELAAAIVEAARKE